MLNRFAEEPKLRRVGLSKEGFKEMSETKIMTERELLYYILAQLSNPPRSETIDGVKFHSFYDTSIRRTIGLITEILTPPKSMSVSGKEEEKKI